MAQVKKFSQFNMFLHTHTEKISFILLLCSILTLTFFFVFVQKQEELNASNFDFPAAALTFKEHVDQQTAPLHALMQTHIAFAESVYTIAENASLRANFVKTILPAFTFNSQIYYIIHILEDGTSLLVFNFNHLKRLPTSSYISKYFKELSPPTGTQAVLFSLPSQFADKEATIEYYGHYAELLESIQTNEDFENPQDLPFYANTINAKTPRTSLPYLDYISETARVTISYPTQTPAVASTHNPSLEQLDKAQLDTPVKGVYALTVHLDPSIFQEERAAQEASIYLLDNNLTSAISANLSGNDLDILVKSETRALINNSMLIYEHTKGEPIVNEKGILPAIDNLLIYHKENNVPIINAVNKFTLNDTIFDYSVTPITIYGEIINLLVLHQTQSVMKDNFYFYMLFSLLFPQLLLLIASYYLTLHNKQTILTLTSQVRRLANYDFSMQPLINCHTPGLLSLQKSIINLRTILIEAFAQSPYKEVIKFDFKHPGKTKETAQQSTAESEVNVSINDSIPEKSIITEQTQKNTQPDNETKQNLQANNFSNTQGFDTINQNPTTNEHILYDDVLLNTPKDTDNTSPPISERRKEERRSAERRTNERRTGDRRIKNIPTANDYRVEDERRKAKRRREDKDFYHQALFDAQYKAGIAHADLPENMQEHFNSSYNLNNTLLEKTNTTKDNNNTE